MGRRCTIRSKILRHILDDSTRSPETLTIPTAGVFNKGNWTIEFTFEPITTQLKDSRLWQLWNNSSPLDLYQVVINSSGKPYLEVYSNGTQYATYSGTEPVLNPGNKYRFSLRGDGSYLTMFIDGQQVGSKVSYVEPTYPLATNMYFGSTYSGTGQPNGIIDDLRISSRARTFAEHQTIYDNGSPLPVDKYTTYKLDFEPNWSWEGENINGLTGRFSGPVTSSNDKAVGKYSVMVNTQDDNPYNWGHYWFRSPFKYMDTDVNSKVTIWVKPGRNAKIVRFWIWDEADGRDEEITNDKNHDGYFKVGEDLESGKWNKVTLDLKQTSGGGALKYASNLQIITNEFSTWYWDEAKTEYSPVTKLDISKMPNSYTQFINGSVRYKTTGSTPVTYGTTPTVLTTQSDPQTFSKGRVEKITINSNYVDTAGAGTQLQSSYKLVPGVNANKMVVSGNGNKIFYLNTADLNKLYLYDRTTNVNRKLTDETDIIELKTDFAGNLVVYAKRSSNDLWYFDTRNNTSSSIPNSYYSYNSVSPKFTVTSAGNTYYYYNYNSSSYYLRKLNGEVTLVTSGSGYMAASDEHLFYTYQGYDSNNVGFGDITRYSLTPVGWKRSYLISSPKLSNLSEIISNKDGTVLYIRANNNLFSFDVNNKVLKQLNAENVNQLVKVTDDNRVFYMDTYNDFFAYDPNSDASTRIRPATVSNNIFGVNDSGSTIFYNESGGIFAVALDFKSESTVNLTNNPLLVDVDNNGLPDTYGKYGTGGTTLTATKLVPESGVIGNIWRLTQSSTSEGYIDQAWSAPAGFQPNTTYTVSFKIRHNLTSRDRAEFFVINQTGVGTYVQTVTHLGVIGSDVGSTFKKVKFTFTTTPDFPVNGRLGLRFDHNGSDSGYYDIAEVQIEQNGTDTPFVYNDGVQTSKPDRYVLSFDGKQSWVTPSRRVYGKKYLTVQLLLLAKSKPMG
ncbi:MAG: hypothetical protein M0021_14910 [Clostridia bacterium]|nr:hypothetical protein [Clostridia bacterium]